MGQYLLVETRDPFESADVRTMYGLATQLAEENNDVAVFLVQNGVLATRRASSAGPEIGRLAQRVTVYADDFSLRERGIRPDELADGVHQSGMDELVDLITSGRKVMWH